ncbi:MAG: MBL fold metallo-hydrolase [Tepidiforma sp.]|uniref:MBL fold metallo-hydrolase n=1 Tax=Tepidiforma sp. TaxID=2682230 RepID=UPI002618A114|nr:MBL fold metallo-hydrolase [Tepidiforma sp.]MCX7617042.1 MBL fold metallo-hydrolase [Tepidiforma sp.]
MALEITFLGRTCFRLKGRDGTVLMDPVPPDSGFALGKQQAEIVTLSCPGDRRYGARELVAGEPMVLDAPGEYEIGGVLVTATAMTRADGSRTVSFVVELDGIRVGHLGLPATANLAELKDVDVLLLPVGGDGSLSAVAAADVMTRIEPRVAIPMHYRVGPETLELDPLEKFLKETGTKPEPQPKLQLTRSGLPADLTVVVLEPRLVG